VGARAALCFRALSSTPGVTTVASSRVRARARAFSKKAEFSVSQHPCPRENGKKEKPSEPSEPGRETDRVSQREETEQV